MDLESRIQIARDFLAQHKNNTLDDWVKNGEIRYIPPSLERRQLKYLMVYRFLCWGVYGPVLHLPSGKHLVMIPGAQTHGGNDEPFTWSELDEF